jgi:hypothetical protein
MSDDPFSDDGPTSGPIDAQFEPAPAASEKPARLETNWTALGVVSLVAALIGGVIGLYGADLVRPDQTADLAAAQKRLDARIDEVAAVQAAIADKLSEPAAASAELAASSASSTGSRAGSIRRSPPAAIRKPLPR